MRRVVVTGMGVVSSIGNDVQTFWNNLLEGKSGIDYITSFDTKEFETKLGYEVKDLDMKDIPLRDQKFDSKYINYARIAAKEAYRDSEIEEVDSSRLGVYISTSIGGSEKTEQGLEVIKEKGNTKVSPYLIQAILPNMASGKVAIDFNAKGSNMAHAAACSSGAISIGEAYLKIMNDYEDVIIAGASDSCINDLTIASFQALRAIYKGEDKEVASTPMDKRRCGFTMGEGAAILILEELEHAKKRGAKIYAEIVGYGCNCDATNPVSPDYENITCANAIKDALKRANILPEQVGYINAHGTSTTLNDKTESKAINEIFKNSPYVSSTKGSTGHLLGASGAIEALITVKALSTNTFPHMINFKEKDEECNLNLITKEPLNKEIDYAITNSFGFGGHNACLVFKKWN